MFINFIAIKYYRPYLTYYCIQDRWDVRLTIYWFDNQLSSPEQEWNGKNIARFVSVISSTNVFDPINIKDCKFSVESYWFIADGETFNMKLKGMYLSDKYKTESEKDSRGRSRVSNHLNVNDCWSGKQFQRTQSTCYTITFWH